MVKRKMNMSVTLTDSEFEQYTVAAHMLNTTKSQLIRDALSEYLGARKSISAKKFN
jgi:hypothetical protein